VVVDILFGEGYLAAKLVFGLVVVIGLLFAFFWGLRRFGGERLGGSAARGRQPRLAVIDAATVDGRRRLVLIRRDNVEHLLIIGGPTDVVIEQNIVRAAGAQVPARPPSAADTLPRAVPLGEGSMWPLQPDTMPRLDATRLDPAARLEPAARPDGAPRSEPRPEPRAEPRAEPRLEPAARHEPRIDQPARPEPRLQRGPPAAEQRPPPVHEEQMDWSAEQELPSPPPPPQPSRDRRPRTVDPLAGLAEELSRSPGPLDPVQMDPPLREAPQREPAQRQMMEPPPLRPMEPPPQRQPRREQQRDQRAAPRPQPAPPQQSAAAAQPQPPAAPAEQFNSSADQNLAEMAQRLEAALRRPAQGPNQAAQPPQADDGRSAAPPAPPQRAPRPAAPEPAAAEMEEEYEEQATPVRAAAGDGSRPQRAEPRPTPRGDAKPAAPQKSLYDSLEQEMASLLGRPNTKP
jgi:flagellar protein FliO/FliZ